MSSIESAESTLDSPRGDRPRTLRNYIAGGWRDAGSTETLDDVNPASGEVTALVPLSGAADVDAAVWRPAPHSPSGGDWPLSAGPAP